MKFFANRRFTRKKILRSKNNNPPAFRQKGRGVLLFVNLKTNIIAGEAGKMQNFGIIYPIRINCYENYSNLLKTE